LLFRRQQLRIQLAFLLTVLVLFFGVALFSTLHKHSAGVCSLDNFEHQIVSLAESAITVVVAPVAVAAEVPPDVIETLLGDSLAARGRAPPSFS